MTAQVVGIELDVSNRDFRLVRVDSRVCLREAVSLQHVQQSSLASVVQPQENYVCVLLEKAGPRKHGLEEVVDEHFF